MKLPEVGDFEVLTDTRTVWVNGADGMNLGRYGPRGVDVHVNFDGQLAGGYCADCFVRTDDPRADWDRFRESMKRVHDIDVSDGFRPAS